MCATVGTVGKGAQNGDARKGYPCCRVEFRKGLGGAATVTSASSFSEVLMEGKTDVFQPFLSYLLRRAL